MLVSAVILLLLCMICSTVESFRGSNLLTKKFATRHRMTSLEVESIIQLATPTSLPPHLLLADGGGINSFAYPLAISALTMIPFLYYQQALKPKARTVKQIELDENLRPIDKSQSKGSVGDARASKRK